MEGLPLSHEKNVLLVVVDRFSNALLILVQWCLWLDFSLKIYSNFMACQTLLPAIETQLSLARFGTNYFVSAALNYASVRLITLNPMVKPR